jgi:hypothetical protein
MGLGRVWYEFGIRIDTSARWEYPFAMRKKASKITAVSGRPEIPCDVTVPSAKDEKGAAAVWDLVQGFQTNILSLRSSETTEAAVRQEYIDPFWLALGWDIANAAHRSDAEKDVKVEAPVATIEAERTHNRRPDYIFRIDGFPRFVVEAKKPAVDLTTDRDAIFQAKSYAWSAQIPFAILTNFEQFRLFDATIKPRHGEPERGLIGEFDLHFADYPAQWGVLCRTFSREAVAGGSLERLLAGIKKVRVGRRIRGIDRMLVGLRGSEPVDEVFLAHLESFRLRLAAALYDENRSDFPEADSRHGAARLTEAAQRIIDRLVFLRTCEDRDIIDWGELRELINGAAENRLPAYPAIVARCREFDGRYNGYLFKPHFCEQLAVPDQLLADFVGSLYPRGGPYRFDAIGDDILGIIYERFLGSAITVTQTHVTAEEKPEVRHAGGVYYTPRFAVDTIVRRVVGPKIEGKSPSEVLDLRILDLACGSGSFLIAAFQFLIDHCVHYIAAHPQSAVVPASPQARKKTKAIAFRNGDGTWQLAPDFKAQLLTSCLYGVDIDAQAVEVTIMSLYLKMLEGKLPPHWQTEWQDARLLPPLDNNIRRGNSLLSQTDFDRWLDDKHGGLFGGDADVRFRINAFDWNSFTRGFGRVFEKQPGFDCIIGNPPYIRVQELNKWQPDECEFYKAHYKSARKGNYDIYVVFIERGLELLAPNGLLGFICPHKFWQADYGKGIRKLVADGRHLRSIVDFADQQVFRGATTYTAIQVFSKIPNSGPVDYAKIARLTDGDTQCRAVDSRGQQDDVEAFSTSSPSGDRPWVFADDAKSRWLSSVRASNPTLGEITYKIAQGIVTSCDRVYFLTRRGKRFYSDATCREHDLEGTLVHPLLKGSVHMKRWVAMPTDRYVLFPYENSPKGWRLIDPIAMERRFPKTYEYLLANKELLANRESGRMKERKDWYAYVYPKNLEVMSMPKVLVPSIGTRAEFCLDARGACFFVGSGGGGGGGYAVIPSVRVDLRYLCGLLNSALLDDFLKAITSRFHSNWFAYSKLYLAQLPIKLPRTAEERNWASRIRQRVQRIIGLRKQLAARMLGDHERDILEREVEAHEKAIDELVCRLYGVDAPGDLPKG